MAGRRALFRKVELERALAVVTGAGIADYRIEFTPDGVLAIVIGAAAKPAGSNSFDEIIGKP